MTQIVRWQEIVGEDNLDTFVKIQKAIVYAERVGQTEDDVFAKMKDRQEDIEMWKTKRRLMKFCGYDSAGRKMGWFKAVLDGNELKFLTTAHEGRVYITLSSFLDMKRERQQDADEADYYGETQKLIKDLAHTKPKRRADLDGFTHEED